MDQTHECVIDSPAGRLQLVLAEDGVLHGLYFAKRSPLTSEAEIPAACHPLIGQLAEYFAGERQQFDFEIEFDGTEFQRRVWLALRGIPYGQTWTYGELAAHIGAPKASRAVGAACGQNPISIVVPCHRVVGSDGSLTGFGGGIETKRWLLGHETGHALLQVQ